MIAASSGASSHASRRDAWQAKIAEIEGREQPAAERARPCQERRQNVQQVRQQQEVGGESRLAQHQDLCAGRGEQADGDHQCQRGAQRAAALADAERRGEVEDQHGVQRDERQDVRVARQRQVPAGGRQGDREAEPEAKERQDVGAAPSGARAMQGGQARFSVVHGRLCPTRR